MIRPRGSWFTRRDCLRLLARLSGAVVLQGCALPTLPGPGDNRGPRLTTRPSPPSQSPAVGLQPLRRSGGRGGFLYVPAGYRPEVPLSLVVLFHGAGQDASELMTPHVDQMKSLGLAAVLLAADSRDYSWDRLSNGIFGPDIEYLEYALGYTFARCAIDPGRIVFAGFSDGATYAAGLGLANGDLVPRVVAYSPGGILSVPPVGKPGFFITHGIRDTILPIDQASRVMVPALRDAGYSVEYREWDGGHGVSTALLREAVTWMVA